MINCNPRLLCQTAITMKMLCLMKKITDAADRPVYTRARRNVGHLLDREGEESGDDGGDEEDEEGDPDGGGPGDGHRQPAPLPP